MSTKELELKFEKPIQKLSLNHQLAFIYFLAERLFPIYKTFSEIEKWGRP